MVKTVGENPTEADRGTLRKVLIIVMPVLILVTFIVMSMVAVNVLKKPQEKKRNFRPLAVMAAYAYKDDIRLSVKTQGEVRPRTEIDLVPEVSGKIVYVSPNFIEGGIFKKGETLIRIEDSDYKVAVIQAEANVAQAEQLLVREIAEGEVARRDYEELGRGEPTALALRQPQRQQAEAGLQAAKAQLLSAELQLKRTSVRAPFSGRVKSKNSDLGQFVSPGARLGRIFSTDIVEVRLPLTDADLSKLELPMAFVAKSVDDAPKVVLSSILAGQKRQWDGYIMRTDSTYDTQTRALFAIVEVFDPYGKGAAENGFPLAPGLFVDAELSGKKFDDVIVLPRDGLRPQNKVYIVDEKGKGEVREVGVIETNSQRAVLSSGVNVGELVVLSPLEESAMANPLKVLDVNDPLKVLVEPERPKWMDETKEDEGDDKKKESRKKRDKKKEAGGGSEADGKAPESNSAEN